MSAISLAALTILDAGPVGQVYAAHEGGFTSVGLRLQPLLGIYPAHAARRQRLRDFTAAGGRRLQDWLAEETVVPVPLPPAGLRNANRPDDAIGLWP
jgi:molybdopterin-guanine dinucleotide biosynthesis protein A